MLCERGVRTFSDFSRNTLDLAVVPAVKKRSHLPILWTRATVQASATKYCAFRARGGCRGRRAASVEVHHEPERALPTGCNPSSRKSRGAQLGSKTNRRCPAPYSELNSRQSHQVY